MRALERDVERKIKRWADEHKDRVLYWKFTVPGLRGVPDRICLFKGGVAVFVELKRPGGRQRKLQRWVSEQLQTFGFDCFVFDCPNDAIEVLEKYL